ncbi:organic cation transporter protein-like isoform X2 [Bradysia coprophila]|nr:organic cation transporter protein-like isoform X2 [Bradysia coprophila]
MACVLFTAPTPNPGEFYCHQPENNLPSDGVFIHKTHRPMTLQKDLYDMDFCHTYNRTHNGEFEEDVLVPCTSFHFDSVFETAVTKFSLVCSRSILISVAQLSHLFGVLTGGILANIIMETMSPRKLLLCGMWTQIIAGCLASYVPHNYIHLMILRYLAAVCCSQMYTAGQVIFTDITGGIHRSVAICLFESFWSIGVILLPLIAYIDPNWSSIFFMISLPTLLYIPLWFLIPDSPTWYLKKHQVDKAEDIIREGVQTNNTQHLLPNDLRQRLLDQMASNSKEPLVTEWCSLWKGRRTVLHLVALHIAWCVCVTNYNGLLLNVKAFGRDYLSENTIALGVSEIIGVFIGLILILTTEKKWRYAGIINIFAGLVASLGFFLPNSHLISDKSKNRWLILTAVIPKIAVSCSQSILFTCTAELVSAEKRKILIFSCVVWARMCLLTAPFIGALSAVHQVLSLSVFGILNIFGGFAMSILSSPKTLDRKGNEHESDLPDINVSGRIFSIELRNTSDCTSIKSTI